MFSFREFSFYRFFVFFKVFKVKYLIFYQINIFSSFPCIFHHFGLENFSEMQRSFMFDNSDVSSCFTIGILQGMKWGTLVQNYLWQLGIVYNLHLIKLCFYIVYFHNSAHFLWQFWKVRNCTKINSPLGLFWGWESAVTSRMP